MFRPQIQKTRVLAILAVFNFLLFYFATYSKDDVLAIGYEEKFKAWPAAQRVHHSYLGGLLEHTLSVTKTCIYLADKYEVCADLLLAAAMVHDIGKLDELSTRGGTEYTDKGKLVGHVVLGRDILREHAKNYSKLPEDFLLHLEHLILAHQGQLDWGTIKVPMSPEALLLHYADDIDAKFNIMKRAASLPTSLIKSSTVI